MPAVNYYEHHLGDYVRDTAHLSMLEDGAYRRLMDACYIREKPLPLEMRECYKLARATSAADRRAVAYVIAQFFTAEKDGYHQGRIDEEIERYLETEPEREARRQGDKERKRRSRERRARLFEALREFGETPRFNASMSDLEAQLSRVRARVTNGTGHSNVTRPVTRDGTASQSPVPSPQSPNSNPHPPPTPSSGGQRGGGLVENGQTQYRTVNGVLIPDRPAKTTAELEAEEAARAQH